KRESGLQARKKSAYQQESSQRHQILAAALKHLLIKPAHRILREMRRLPMGVRCGRVLVLLINEHRVRIPFDTMWNVTNAAGFLPRSLGEQTQDFGDVFPVFRRKLHPDSKADHREKILPVARSVDSHSIQLA